MLIRNIRYYFFSGNEGLEYFFEAQKIVYDDMEQRFYGDFALSRDYTEFICQSESAFDVMRAHTDTGSNKLIDWSEGYKMMDKVSFC